MEFIFNENAHMDGDYLADSDCIYGHLDEVVYEYWEPVETNESFSIEINVVEDTCEVMEAHESSDILDFEPCLDENAFIIEEDQEAEWDVFITNLNN
jgi:hypothetical protein